LINRNNPHKTFSSQVQGGYDYGPAAVVLITYIGGRLDHKQQFMLKNVEREPRDARMKETRRMKQAALRKERSLALRDTSTLAPTAICNHRMAKKMLRSAVARDFEMQAAGAAGPRQVRRLIRADQRPEKPQAEASESTKELLGGHGPVPKSKTGLEAELL